MSDNRSKTPTLKTLADAPKAKAGPRVEVIPARAEASKASNPPVRDSMEDAATHVFDSGKFTRQPINDTLMDPEISETYSRIDPSELEAIPAPLQAVSMMPRPPKLPQNDDGTFKQEVSTPIRAISMKTPGDAGRARAETPPRALPQVKLRAMADVSKQAAPQNLGYLAPPRDHREVRARRSRELVIWGSICVMLACAFALGIWFLAK